MKALPRKVEVHLLNQYQVNPDQLEIVKTLLSEKLAGKMVTRLLERHRHGYYTVIATHAISSIDAEPSSIE